MKKEVVKYLTEDFESYANKTENGIEFWFARDLQHLLGYSEWRNFTKVINKAKTACETAGHEISDHFVDVNKMVQIGSGTEREIIDIMLTRFACYLIAQNGDPKKEAGCKTKSSACRFFTYNYHKSKRFCNRNHHFQCTR